VRIWPKYLLASIVVGYEPARSIFLVPRAAGNVWPANLLCSASRACITSPKGLQHRTNPMVCSSHNMAHSIRNTASKVRGARPAKHGKPRAVTSNMAHGHLPQRSHPASGNNFVVQCARSTSDYGDGRWPGQARRSRSHGRWPTEAKLTLPLV
jgi:hypothetical protein